jgi:hypothetical protein
LPVIVMAAEQRVGYAAARLNTRAICFSLGVVETDEAVHALFCSGLVLKKPRGQSFSARRHAL